MTATVILVFSLEPFLPAPLQDYLKAEADRELKISDAPRLLGALLFLAAFLTSSIGLFVFKRWARWLYLGDLIVACLLSIFGGPSVEPAGAAACGYAATVLSGVILGISFFTDALNPRPSSGT